jgi:hypothetical protein
MFYSVEIATALYVTKIENWTTEEWNAATAEWAKDTAKWTDCEQKSTDQKLTGTKSRASNCQPPLHSRPSIALNSPGARWNKRARGLQNHGHQAHPLGFRRYAG